MPRLLKHLTYLLALLCVGCQPTTYQSQAYVFGTLVEVQIDGLPQAQAALASNAVLKAYQQWHQRLHAWQAGELQTINQAIADKQDARIPVAKDLTPLLKQAQVLSIKSQGLFNPAIGQLVDLWGFHRDQFTPQAVDMKQRDQLLAQHPNMQDLEIHDDYLISRNPAVKLDLGGFAKGYALDQGMQILKQHGVQHALINIGGNVMALGQHQGKAWRVGVQHPRKPSALAALDLPSGWAIGTSGDYQRYYVKDHVRYCHIIDPNTGAPVQHMQSVTVLIPPQTDAGVLSDVASKPIFISPPALQNQMARRMGVENYMLIDASGQITASRAMAERLTWIDAEAKAHAKIAD